MSYWPLLILISIPVFWLVMLHLSKYWKSEYDKNEEKYSVLSKGIPKNISSNMTFIYKYIFPTLICPLPLFLLFAFFDMLRQGVWYAWLILLITLLNTYLWWSLFKIKKISVDSKYLYISNYIKSWQVPLIEIDNIKEVFGASFHLITIKFKNKLEMGKEVVFMSTWRERVFGSDSHPTVAELEELRSNAINMNA